MDAPSQQLPGRHQMAPSIVHMSSETRCPPTKSPQEGESLYCGRVVGDVVQAPITENLTGGEGAASDDFTSELHRVAYPALMAKRVVLATVKRRSHITLSPTRRASCRGFRTMASMEFVCWRSMCRSSVALTLDKVFSNKKLKFSLSRAT
jgi:hypothetical protein